jgi:hypothetical protein
VGTKIKRQPAEASDIPATDAPMSTQRLRAGCSSPECTSAVLQLGVPASSAKVVAVEGPATLPGNGGGPTEAEWSKANATESDSRNAHGTFLLYVDAGVRPYVQDPSLKIPAGIPPPNTRQNISNCRMLQIRAIGAPSCGRRDLQLDRYAGVLLFP